jgi:hypothetical protein
MNTRVEIVGTRQTTWTGIYPDAMSADPSNASSKNLVLCH